MRVVINGNVYTKVIPVANDANACEKALASPMKSNDFDDVTICDWLHALMFTLWNEGESFSGKRPFGNSGWESELIDSLIDCGYIPGIVYRGDEGYAENSEYDEIGANELIVELIRYVFYRK